MKLCWDSSEIPQRFLGGSSGTGHVLRDVLVEVVAHHEHVEVLVDRVHREGPARVGNVVLSDSNTRVFLRFEEDVRTNTPEIAVKKMGFVRPALRHGSARVVPTPRAEP